MQVSALHIELILDPIKQTVDWYILLIRDSLSVSKVISTQASLFALCDTLYCVKAQQTISLEVVVL